MEDRCIEEGGDLREGKLVEEVGEPQDAQRSGEGSATRWKGVGQGAVIFMFDIDARSMLSIYKKSSSGIVNIYLKEWD